MALPNAANSGTRLLGTHWHNPNAKFWSLHWIGWER